MIGCEQRGRERRTKANFRLLDWTDNAATRFGCKMLRSLSDKVQQRLFSEASVEQAAKELTLMLWSKRTDGDRDLCQQKVEMCTDYTTDHMIVYLVLDHFAPRSRWYLKP